MKWNRIILGVGCLLLGIAIYLVLRSETIHLYRWCASTLGTSWLEPLREYARGWAVPNFVRYSLPDGLYCASYILIADGIWASEKGWWKNVVVSAIPVVAMTHELLQLAGLARGTFSMADLLCYALPIAAWWLIEKRPGNHFPGPKHVLPHVQS